MKKCDGATLYPGVSASVSMGGTTWSGTTDSNGKFCTPGGLAAGTWSYSLTAPDAGYNSPKTGTITLASNTGCFTQNVTFPILSSYCCNGCFTQPYIPLDPTTLSFSSALMGSATLTGTCGTSWSGTLTYAYPGNGSTCPAASVQVTVTVTLSVSSGIDFSSISINYPVDVNGCPGGTGGGTFTENSKNSQWTSCSSSPFSFGGSTTWGNIYNTDSLLNGQTDSVTVSA